MCFTPRARVQITIGFIVFNWISREVAAALFRYDTRPLDAVVGYLRKKKNASNVF